MLRVRGRSPEKILRRHAAFCCIRRCVSAGRTARTILSPQPCAIVLTIAHDDFRNHQKCPKNRSKLSSFRADCCNSFCALWTTSAQKELRAKTRARGRNAGFPRESGVHCHPEVLRRISECRCRRYPEILRSTSG